MNDRHTEEGSEEIFFYLRDIFETRMALSVGEVVGFGKPPYQPDDPFVKG